MKHILIICSLLIFNSAIFASSSAPGTIKWSFSTQEPPVGDLVMGPNNAIYVSSTTGSINAHLWSINATNGQKNWAYNVDYDEIWEPDVNPSSGDIAVTSANEADGGLLYYLSPNGTLLWKSDFRNITTKCSGNIAWPGKAAITNDGNIYVPFMNVCNNMPQQNVDSNVAVFNSSGAPLSYKLYGPTDPGTLIFGNVRPYAYSWLSTNKCYKTAHGALATCTLAEGTGSDVSNPPQTISGTLGAVFSGTSEVQGDGGESECVDTPTARCVITPAVNNTTNPKTFYYGDTYSIMIPWGGIDPWFKTSTDMTYARPLVDSQEVVYDGGINGFLYVVNPDGTIKHEFFVSTSGIYHRVALDPDGTIYVTTGDGSVVAIDGTTGEIKWRMAVNAKTAPLVGPDGTVYVDTTPGIVYAFNGEPRTL